MPKNPLEKFLDGYGLDEIKKMLFALIEQVFPVMDSSEKQDFILKLLGETGDEKLPSMVSK
jgi:hypothetical protein